MPFDPNDEETKAALKKIADEAVEEATQGLVNKNKELLGELKLARKGREIDPAELDAKDAEIDELKANLSKAEKAAQKAVKELGTATEQLNSERESAKKLVVNNGLSSALSKANVAPHFMDSVTALLSGKVSLDDDRNVMVGDKPLQDFVTEWSQSDEGKHYIAAPNNAGGGGGGPGGTQGAKTITRPEFEALGPKERMAYTKDGGTVTD